MRWTRMASPDERRFLADGEVVWSSHPDADVKLATMLSHRADDGGKKARLTRESAKETVKTIVQGMPDRFGEPVVTELACFFTFARKATGASRARHSLRPLLFSRDTDTQNSSAWRAAGS